MSYGGCYENWFLATFQDLAHGLLLFVLFWQHFNCWLSAWPGNFLFGSCRNKLQKKEKKKCCIYLYRRTTKASSPPLPPGVGKEMEICNHSVAENWATTLKLWIYWVPKMSSQALEADSQICLNKNIYIIYMDFIKQTFCSLHHTLLSFHGPQ